MANRNLSFAFKSLALFALVTMATTATAATIVFTAFDKKTKQYYQETMYGDVDSWSFTTGVVFTYDDTSGPAPKKVKKTIARKNVMSATLSEPQDYSDTLKKAVASHKIADYQAVLGDGQSDKIQKDYASWRIANISASQGGSLEKAMRKYLADNKNGNFRRDALMRLARATRGAKYLGIAKEIAALGDDYSSAQGNLMVGEYHFGNKKNSEAKTALETALKAGTEALSPDVIVQANSLLGRITGEAKYFEASNAVDARNFMDLTGRDKARGYAHMGLGKIAADGGKNEDAYKAYIKASFWLGPYGSVEGDCIKGAYDAAAKIAGTNKAWESRRDALKTVLQESYPKLLK